MLIRSSVRGKNSLVDIMGDAQSGQPDFSVSEFMLTVPRPFPDTAHRRPAALYLSRNRSEIQMTDMLPEEAPFSGCQSAEDNAQGCTDAPDIQNGIPAEVFYNSPVSIA